MSIRPVDMQVLIPKASEVAKTHNLNNGEQSLAAQQSFKNEIDKHYNDLTTTVTDPNKSESLVDEDGSNKDKDRRQRQRKRREKDKKEEAKKSNNQQGLFNIQI